MPGHSSVSRENHNEVQYGLGQIAALGTASVLQMKMIAVNYPFLANNMEIWRSLAESYFVSHLGKTEAAAMS